MSFSKIQRKYSNSSLNTQVSDYDAEKLGILVRKYWDPNEKICLQQKINQQKFEKIKSVFYSIHQFKYVLTKKFRENQKYRLYQGQQNKKKLQIYIDYDSITDPDNVPQKKYEQLIDYYYQGYGYLEELIKNYCRKHNDRSAQSGRIDVEYFFEINSYVFLAARKLLLHLKLDIELMTENMTFESQKQKIKEMHKDKILEIAIYLAQRFNHAEKKAREFEYFDKISDFAQNQFQYKKWNKLFSVLKKIRKLIKNIKQKIEQFLQNEQMDRFDLQNLMIFCQFIGKLEGPKCRTSQFLLFELQHIKTIHYLFKVKSQQAQFTEFIKSKTEEICSVILAQMKFKFVFSETPKIYMNTHGFRFEELKILLVNLFSSLSRWRKNGDLNRMLMKSDRNEAQAFIFLEIQQGFGNHTQKQELAIQTALRRFKEENETEQNSILKKTNIDYQVIEQLDSKKKHILVVKVYFQNLFCIKSYVDFPKLPQLTEVKEKEIIQQLVYESDEQLA